MLKINLYKKHSDDLLLLSKIKEMNLLQINPHNQNFKVGDMVEFISGYNMDILYTTKIVGFDLSGFIYILWDCYWFPIKDIEYRKIKVI